MCVLWEMSPVLADGDSDIEHHDIQEVLHPRSEVRGARRGGGANGAGCVHRCGQHPLPFKARGIQFHCEAAVQSAPVKA